MKSVPVALVPKKPVTEDAVGMSFHEAMASPCATCETSPCCAYLPLHRFEVNDLTALDHAVYLSNFDRIELGIAANGEWHVYYRYPCRYLDRETMGCTIHNQPHQPNICVNYNPYTCWYKRVLTPITHPEFLRLDGARLQIILDHIEFDEERHIVRVPNWDWLVETFATMPLTPEPDWGEPPADDPVLREWEEITLGTKPDRAYEILPHSDPALRDPCGSCEAYCCTSLTFPLAKPSSMTNFDYMQFCLGFPGVEISVNNAQWSLVVRTTCRHLEGTRCGVYDQPDRPLVCRYYDALSCSYKPLFGTPRPAGHVRLRLEHYPMLLDAFRFNDRGEVITSPDTAELRERIEETWRARGPIQPVTAPAPTAPVAIGAAAD